MMRDTRPTLIGTTLLRDCWFEYGFALIPRGCDFPGSPWVQSLGWEQPTLARRPGRKQMKRGNGWCYQLLPGEIMPLAKYKWTVWATGPETLKDTRKICPQRTYLD